MEELVKGQMLIDDMAKAIAEGKDEEALKYYEEYKKIYQKMTGEELPMKFEELINVRKPKTDEEK